MIKAVVLGALMTVPAFYVKGEIIDMTPQPRCMTDIVYNVADVVCWKSRDNSTGAIRLACRDDEGHAFETFMPREV